MSGAGADLARDIETGFLNRLALTPMSGVALVAGQLAGAVALGVFQAFVFIAVGLAAGATLEAGVAGRAGDRGAVDGDQLRLRLRSACSRRSGSATARRCRACSRCCSCSCSCPRWRCRAPLIEQDWFRTIATYNPVSYLLEGIRSLFIVGFDGEALALAFGCARRRSARSSWRSPRANVRTRLVRT